MPRLATIAGAFLTALTVSPAVAQDQWTGPRLGAATAFGWGTAEHNFLTAGFFNPTAGDTFTAAVRGNPFTVTAGYDWQDGPLVYGLGITMISGRGGTSNYDIPSPYDPDQGFRVQFHWAATMTGRIGFSTGRTLIYAEAGPAFIHLINEAYDDNAGRVRLGDWPLGMTAGVGIERAFGPHLSITLAYQVLAFGPAGIYQSNNGPTPTNYEVRYNARLVSVGTIWRFDPAATANAASPPFDWTGFYAGTWVQSPITAGATTGFNILLGDRFVAGPVARFGKIICCSHGWTWDAMARLGYLIEDDLLLYAEAGIRARDADRFYAAGAGLEFAMTSRLTGLMQMQGITRPGEGFREAAFTGGINFYFAR